jgi:hypothetical protein
MRRASIGSNAAHPRTAPGHGPHQHRAQRHGMPHTERTLRPHVWLSARQTAGT